MSIIRQLENFQSCLIDVGRETDGNNKNVLSFALCYTVTFFFFFFKLRLESQVNDFRLDVLRQCVLRNASLLYCSSGQSVMASDFGSNGPRFESGRGRCVESLDKARYSHCPKEKPSH